MKIAYVSTYSARDVKNWSGTGYFIAHSLKQQSLPIHYIDNLKKERSPITTIKWMYQKLWKKRYLLDRDKNVLKSYAKQVSKELNNLDTDIVFSPGTIPITYLRCSQQIVFWTDCTFASMVDFYPEFSSLSPETIKLGNDMEQTALANCDLAIYSSQWAAKSAIDNYHVDPGKIKVVPFGANIICDRNLDDIHHLVNNRPTDVCKLLFIGVHWKRKGGDIALQVAQQLNKMGLKTELTIVGCYPVTDTVLPDFIKPLGFISKLSSEGIVKINQLLAESHFLILPSRAEAFGIVFCEASSFGLPSLATNVGGIPTIIRDGYNGKTFKLDASIDEYCLHIKHLFDDYSQYKSLAISSFNEYQTRLNWSVNGKKVKELLMANG
jgi:glycosyltransferase involved in cell wall biosynthesis